MPHPVPLKPTTVRFAEDGLELVQRAAERAGCTIGQFIREAALMRAVIVLANEYQMGELDRRAREIPPEGNGDSRVEEIKRLGRRND